MKEIKSFFVSAEFRDDLNDPSLNSTLKVNCVNPINWTEKANTLGY